MLIGDGPERRRLLERAKLARIDIMSLGAVPHEDALAWIAAASVVLAPLARGEGSPMVIREANALGTKVVSFA
ncbi:MAG: hypothetical protein NVS3B20_19600 [Polyangiales bacterium]